jgi:hypothetical protein
MTTTRGARFVVGLATGIAGLGAVGLIVAGWLLPNAILVVLGLGGLLVAAGLWRGSDTALVVALVSGPPAILPGLFGAWGLKVTAEGWLEMCADSRLASLASYPPDYCERVNWVSQWGIGLGLTGAGIAGVLLFVVLMVAGRRLEEPRSVTEP